MPSPINPRNYKVRLEAIDFTTCEIKDKLKNVKVDKSQGLDKIHPRLLKEFSKELRQPLQCLFDKSVKTGKVPEMWKRATVSAIFKKGCRKNPSDYRPISFTCVICKVLESIIGDRILNHLLENNLLSPKQFGFMSGRSITFQMLNVMNAWTEALATGG